MLTEFWFNINKKPNFWLAFNAQKVEGTLGRHGLGQESFADARWTVPKN